MASMVIEAAAELCGGRLVVAQEGGYHLTALAWCVRRTIELMRGDEPTPDPVGTVESTTPAGFHEMLSRVRSLHGL
jgi:hypothetical protein